MTGRGRTSGCTVVVLALLVGCVGEVSPPPPLDVPEGESPTETNHPSAVTNLPPQVGTVNGPPLSPSSISRLIPGASFAGLPRRARPNERPAFPPPPKSFTYPPLQTKLETYRIEIAPELLQLFYEDEDTPPKPATWIHEDGRREGVQMRLRGNSSRGWPKKSWRIEFPAGMKFQGRRKLNLISSWREQTMMIEKLAYDMLEAMGVPASKCKYVLLYINGQYQGVYLDLERVDQSFMQRAGFLDPDGTIYRCGRKNCEMKTYDDFTYQDTWEKETNELLPNTELESFLHAINHTPEPQLLEMLEQRLELEHYLRIMVAEALVTMGTVEDSRSYWLHDAITGRWSYGPWDFNNTDAKLTVGNHPGKVADFEHPLFNFSLFDGWVAEEYRARAEADPGRWKIIFSNLNTRIVNHPGLRKRLLDLYEQGVAELLDNEAFSARVDAIYRLLEKHMQNAPHMDPALFNDGPRYLKEYAQNRSRFLRAQIGAWRTRKPTLVLNAIDPNAGWIELKNLGTSEVSLAGMVLTTNLRDNMRPNLPAATIGPGKTARFTASELSLALAADGELGLFDGKSVVGVVDLLFYGRLPAGSHYARNPTDPERWEIHQGR